MHANLPEIANRWEAKYGLGGIAELNSQLNQLPEYYLPKNQGGRIGFDSGSNGITLGSDRYNITLEPGASGSWTSQDLGHGYNVDEKNITYGVDTTANVGPVEIGIDFKNFLDKFDVTKDGTTVEKDTQKDKQIAYSLGLNLEDLYAKIDSDEEFENWYFTIRKTFSGGGTPAHEAGIYGLNEGGNIRLQPHTASDLLVQKTLSGERPKYQPPGYSGSPGQETRGDTRGESRGPSHLSHNAPPETKTTPTPDPDRGWQTYAIEDPKKTTTTDDKDIKKGPQEDWTEDDVKKAIKEGERKKELRELALRGEKTEDWEKKQEWNKPRSGFWGILGKGILAAASFGLLGPGAAKLASYYTTGTKFHNIYTTGKIDLGFGKKLDVSEHIDKTKSILNKRQIAEDKLMASLPKGHPERMALEAKKATNKLRTRDEVPDRDGVEITMDVEKVNDANADKAALEQKYQEMDEASMLAWQRQQEMEAKRQAYLRNFRQTYMSAQGGRVPAGYNTGGLSNLFRLKNV